MEFADYQASPEVLRRLPRVDFVAVIGPTAAGKTTLIDAVGRRNTAVHTIMVTTSRPPRSGEQNEIDFHFRALEEMQERAARGEYVQVAPRVLGPMYATAPEDYVTEGLSIMPVIADAMPSFLALPFKRLRQLFVLPPDWESWWNRIQSRDFTPEQIAKRLDEAKTSLAYALRTSGLQFVINGQLNCAIDEAEAYILSDKAAAPIPEAHALAAELLTRLKNEQKLIK